MAATSIRDKIQNEYITKNLENAKKINYTSLTEKDGYFTCLYKDLHDTTIKGYPIASDFVGENNHPYSVDEFADLSKEAQEKCGLRFHYLPCTQEIYLGSTGSGKTTGCVEPQLRAISSQKNKPNLFITDPKGELFDKNSDHLKNEGYKIFVLNFKDTLRSDKWNPLYELYDLKMGEKEIAKNAVMHEGKPREGLSLASDFECFKETYIECDGFAFPNDELFEEYKRYLSDSIEIQISFLINQMAYMMINPEQSKDPTWEYGAQNMLKGLFYCMLEDAIKPESGFTKEMMTFKTLQRYYDAIKTPVLNDNSSTTIYNHPLLKDKSKDIITLFSVALDNAKGTMRCYCGVFDGAMKDWFQGHIFSLTTNDTIKLDRLGDQPFAIFLITRDYEKSDFLIAGLFVDSIYRKMLIRAEKDIENGITPRDMHFLLDEFGNIPKINDFENKISTARSRNIWFHLVLQSYSQLENVYNPNVAQIIKDNCSQIFLGSTNSKTKEDFSRACGRHCIERLSSILNPHENEIFETPLIPVSNLNEIKPGQLYTLRDKMPVIFSQYERSYICQDQGSFADRKTANGLKTNTPTLIESFSNPKYHYPALDDKRFH